MARVEMDEEHSGISTTAPSRSQPTDHVTCIHDLPREVMEIIFENLDSISRKKIERVCKGWMQIIRGARKFRTHLLIELPSFFVRPVDPHWQGFYFEDWCARLRNLIKPDLKVLHFMPPRVLVNIERAQPAHLVKKNGLNYIRVALRHAGADLSIVDILFSDCTIDCDFIWHTLTETKKELFLETPDKLPEQTAKLFLAENGPLTETQSDIFGKLEKHVGRLLVVDANLDIGFLHNIVQRIALIKGRYYADGYNWMEALTTVVNGGHVSKHTADFLGLLKPELMNTIISYL